MAKAKSKNPKVRVLQLEHATGLPLPTYQSEHAAGLDLIAAVPEDAGLVIEPGARFLVPTGLVVELPKGSEGQVRPRSGLALKHGVTVLNAPGTIDSDYRGEIQVLLVNLSDTPFEIRRGERIAQMVVSEHIQVRLKAATTLKATKRGSGGFGSTGRDAAPSDKSPKKKAMPAKPKPAAGGGGRARKGK